MEHPYEYIVDLILAFLITFLFPILYFGLKLDAITQIIVQSETSEFVQDIRSKGYIDKEMYESYLDELAKTNVLFDIRLEHKRQNLEPEYRFRTPGEIIDEQNNAYKGTNEYNYRPVSTEIPNVKDPIDNSGGLNTETNESILENAVKTPANPNHVHTGLCYDGERHSHNGSCDRTYHSVPRTTVEELNDDEYHSGCGGTIHYYAYVTQCSNCGAYFQYSQTTCSGSCGTFAYTSSGGCSCSGYYTYSCGKTEGHYYNGDTEVFPYCHRKAVNIVSTHPTQKVYINEPFITTATATYQDGSTDIVLCNTTYTTNSAVSNETVTLTYKDDTGATLTTNIIVSVIPRNKTCANGHVYNMNNDNTDPGCPFCRAYLKSLFVSYPTSGRITIYKGTTLQENEVMLLATYMDGRKEYLSTGYVDNLDKNYIGTQTVTISYKGKYTTLTVMTKRNLRLCPICNRYYELYPDDTDPGCPYCAARAPVFTGNVLEYDNKYYESDILKKLYGENETYYFSDRDYFTVTATNRAEGRGMGILNYISKSLGEEYIHVVDGGYIREETRK